MELFARLGLALAIGLLVGVERGWKKREAPEGSRIAGIRTFGLIGLLGGLWALLGREFGNILLGIAFATLALLMIVAYIRDVRVDRDVGITSVVAALVTFALGALAVQGYMAVAAAGAVVTTTLLSLKPALHRWLRNVETPQLLAGLKLLLISVVVLPVLPNQGYGPWQALNPYVIWWMVVLIASISFAGYLAIKTVGANRGILLTGLFGGMVSSTATTINLARLIKGTRLQAMLTAGIVVAAATMFPRMLLEVAVVNVALVPRFILPLGLMTLAAAACAIWLAYRQQSPAVDSELPLRNPMELLPALGFGLLLAAIMLLAEAFRAWLGDTGIYVLAAISGIADVDAITLSLARMARDNLADEVVVQATVLAAMVNTAVKGILAVAIAGRAIGLRVLTAFAITLIFGGIGLYFV